MKIVIVTERIYPLYGGAETRYIEIATHLSTLGHEVTILTGRGDITDLHPQAHRYLPNEEYKNCYIRRIFDYSGGKFEPGTRSFRNCFNLGLNTGLFARQLNKKDNIDLLDINVIPYLHIPILKLFAKVPFVITWHEVWGSNWRKQKGIAKFGREIEILNAQLGKERIAVSKFTANRLKKISLNKSHPISVVENGVSKKFFEVENTSGENPHFIYVGRLMPEKNIDTLLVKGFKEILKHYPLAKLDIIGNGVLREKIQSIANKYNQITFHGNVPVKRLLHLLSQANVFVLPSSREGSGIAAREANATGLPVVTVNFPNNATAHETIIHNYNGIITSPRSFVEGMINAYEKREEMYSNAKREAKLFQWEKLVEKLESVYRRVVED